MSRPSKPMAKNSNSKFTPRNNKQDIFTKLAKTAKLKTDPDKQDNIPETHTDDTTEG